MDSDGRRHDPGVIRHRRRGAGDGAVRHDRRRARRLDRVDDGHARPGARGGTHARRPGGAVRGRAGAGAPDPDHPSRGRRLAGTPARRHGRARRARRRARAARRRRLHAARHAPPRRPLSAVSG
ncbi:hypothetical protein EMO91_12855 [Bifidobacterium myosotis]|uniref:Uncharacterized protein n=1 Tax=Bifidobacterium myosotis TaxID=1630166 RepID=A0A5M9ZFU9_9BIFI|nr:hypothetical protein EMO91_12855 [Bifidobacterium myosotis]